jgi:hypothetical protein
MAAACAAACSCAAASAAALAESCALVGEGVVAGVLAALPEVCATAHTAPVIQPSVPRASPAASDTIALRGNVALRTSGLRSGKTFAMSIGILLNRIILKAVCNWQTQT